jgi:hypothetical protein
MAVLSGPFGAFGLRALLRCSSSRTSMLMRHGDGRALLHVLPRPAA